MASGGTSSSKPNAPVSMSPVTAVLAQLFGIGTQIKKGGISLTNSGQSIFNNPVYNANNPLYTTEGTGRNNPIFKDNNNGGGVFTSEQLKAMGVNDFSGGAGGGRLLDKYNGPYNTSGGVLDPSKFASIADLLNPVALRGFEQGTEGIGQAGLDIFNNQTRPALEELLSTGFRTDINPIRANELQRFRSQTVPGIAEQFAGQTGTFSSDFLNALTSAGGTMHTELGALQSQLDEASSGRRSQALLGGAADIPSNVGTGLLNLGEQLRLQQQGATQGGQALALLQALGGLVPTGAIAMSPTQSAAQGGVL